MTHAEGQPVVETLVSPFAGLNEILRIRFPVGPSSHPRGCDPRAYGVSCATHWLPAGSPAKLFTPLDHAPLVATGFPFRSYTLRCVGSTYLHSRIPLQEDGMSIVPLLADRKSTRLNSSHRCIS